MQEPQVAQDKSGMKSNTKWVILILGGGCALLACIALVIGLAVAFFIPVTGEVFSEISKELDTVHPDLSEPSGEILTPDPIRYPNVNANSMGDPDTPVSIIVYSDFQCVYCMKYWDETEG